MTPLVSAKVECIETLKVMYTSRIMDDKMSILVRQNKGGTFHMNALGHELVGAVAALSLTPGKDWGLPYYRDRAFALGLGCTILELLTAFLAREGEHHSGGRMMPDHFAHQGLRIPCQSSVVGSQYLHAVGVALARKETDEVVYVSGGDGSTSQGDFHEALNFSSIHKLPVIFFIQDNGWAISVPTDEQTAGGCCSGYGKGYEGLATHVVDGFSYEEVSKAMKEAVKKGRSGNGPTLIVAKVPRLGPHSSSDDPSKYKEELAEGDPVESYEQWLVEMGLMTADEQTALKEDLRTAIDAAAKLADKVPFPSKKTVRDHLFMDTPDIPEDDGATEESVVMVDAINSGLREEMERDENIVVFGQDVAKGKGGVFGATRSLTEQFGDDRCFNSPLAESTIVGIATGMAMTGSKIPVVEIQFADYLWTAVNQLFNELSSIHYRSNGKWNCPVVIRMPIGGYIQGGPYHSQSIEAFLAHCPGLKIVMPSNAADAKRLLKAAIRDPNPVLFLEHKGLYRQRVFSARPEPTGLAPLGKAKVVREGTDVTVVTWGMTTFMSYEVAEKLHKDEDISAEVIDLRSIAPFDFETVLTSLKKTGKVLIAHEAHLNCGFGAEIAARIARCGFQYLDAPVDRIGAIEVAVPYCKDLEDAVLPQKPDLEVAIRTLANY
jgi:2-oxoisovalerate dehydrogenase E1 component